MSINSFNINEATEVALTELVGDDYNNTAHLDKLDNFQVSDKIIAIGKDNFASFKILHDQIDGDMYWSSERMFKVLENWRIFVREEAVG